MNNEKPGVRPSERVSTALVLLAMALIKVVALVLPCHRVADIVFRAGPECLAMFTAWAGVVANLLWVYFSFSVVADLVKAVHVLRGKEELVFRWSLLSGSLRSMIAGLSTTSPAYDGETIIVKPAPDATLAAGKPRVVKPGIVPPPSAHAEPEDRSHETHVSHRTYAALPLMALSIIYGISPAGAAAAAVLLYAWYRAERHVQMRIPPVLGVIAALGTITLIITLLRIASPTHALAVLKGLAGEQSLTEAALITAGRVMLDGHLITLFVGALIAFLVPPLHDALRPMRAWKAIFALLILGIAGAYAVSGSVRQKLLGRWATGLARETHGVAVGREGWLFASEGLDALTSARRERLTPTPLPSIEDLQKVASTAKELGCQLLLIPVPMKASLYPEAITGSPLDASEAPLYQVNQPTIYEKLTQAGFNVQDITSALLLMKEKRPVFSPHSTLWTPEAMQAMANAISKHVRQRYPGLAADTPLSLVPSTPSITQPGDLALRLGQGSSSQLFPPREQVLVSFPSLEPYDESPILVIGGDALDAYAKHKAGFAEHLAFYLGRRIAVASERSSIEAFLALKAEAPKHKLIIWLVPAADLVR